MSFSFGPSGFVTHEDQKMFQYTFSQIDWVAVTSGSKQRKIALSSADGEVIATLTARLW